MSCHVMCVDMYAHVCMYLHQIQLHWILEYLTPFLFDPKKHSMQLARLCQPFFASCPSWPSWLRMVQFQYQTYQTIYSDTLKQQVVSEEECAPRKTTFTLRVGWNITMRGWCWAASSCHVLRHQIGSWIILLSISSLQRGKPRGHEGPVGGLRKVSIYGVTDGCLWGFRMWRVDSIHWSPCDFWMKVRDSLCQRGCLCKALRLKLEDVYCGNNVRIDLYSMIMNLVGWN